MSQNTIQNLNVELPANQDIPETDIETFNLELEPSATPHKWTKESFSSYRSKLRLLSKIHNDIADKVNQKRQAAFEAFFRPEDTFIPETKQTDLAGMMIASLANRIPSTH